MKDDPATVLVVDDNKDNRNMLTRRLRRQGHNAVMSENGRQALEQMRALPFDLVLLDIMMPEMNGYQVLAHMKADDRLRHIPVIVISAIDELDSVVRCIQLGAEDYLTKPFNRVLLQARIGASLEKKRLRDYEQAFVEELKILQRIDRELNANLDLERALNITLKWAVRQSGSRAGLIGLVDRDGIQIMATEGYAAASVVNQDQFYPPVIRDAVQSGYPRRLNDLEPGGELLDGAKSQIVIPIFRESDVMGVLLLESTRHEGYPEEMLTFLTRLSDHAAMAIANAQLYAEVQAADQAKNDFISLVIHELKTPMTSIRGYTDLLQKGQLGPLNAAQTDFLNIIFSNVIRMDSLVSDLVDVSKIEAGRLRLEFSTVSLADAMGEVVRSMKEQIESKDQALLVHVPEDLPVVWADQNRLVQVLTNLVSNAHKYTSDKGQICVQAEHTANQWDTEGATEVVHLVVQDTGFGIKPEDQGKIFQRFFRSEDDQVRAVSGTGLGLNISKNLVEMQGGRIWFESEFGRGTAFHFTVPVAGAS